MNSDGIGVLHDEHMTVAAPPGERVLDQVVTVTWSARAFCVDIRSVREICSWSPTTELPGQPHGAKGVLDIRASVVQVYDLAVMLGWWGGNSKACQVVLAVSLHRQNVGFLVATCPTASSPSPRICALCQPPAPVAAKPGSRRCS